VRQYKQYSDSDIRSACMQSVSFAGVIKKLNLKISGGNYETIHNKIKELQIDTSHWKGQGWNKDSKTKDWHEYSSKESLKRHLISDKGFKCESCGLSVWLGVPILLEIHHIDGVPSHNEYSNLQLLCLNCHAQTPNYRNRNTMREPNKCMDCCKIISKRTKRCMDCNVKHRVQSRKA